MSKSRRPARDLSSWRVFYAIRDGHVTARAISEHCGIPRTATTQALGRLRDAGVVESEGPNNRRVHRTLTKRPPADMTGKTGKTGQKRPPLVREPIHLWDFWRKAPEPNEGESWI